MARRRALADWGPSGPVGLSVVALSLVPLAAPEAPRLGLLPAGMFLLVGLLLVWRARPAPAQSIAVSEALEALAQRETPDVRLRLTETPADTRGRAGVSYAVVAETPAGTVLQVADAGSPALALAVATFWQRRLGASIVPGWGLTRSDLACLANPSRAALTRRGATHEERSEPGSIATAVSLSISAAALLALVLGVALVREGPLSSLSLALLAFAVSLLLGLALATRTNVIVVSLDEMLTIERRCLGLCWRSVSVRPEDTRLLKVVSPNGRGGRHLLLATREGFWSVECQKSLGPWIEQNLAGPLL